MPPSVAALVYAGLVVLLYWFDRKDEARTSPALWITLLWVLLASSRSPDQWLHPSSMMSDMPDQVMEGSPTDRLFYMGLLAASVVVVIARRSKFLQLLKQNIPIVVFFLFCLLSLAWSDYPGIAVKRWSKAVGDFLMLAIVFTEAAPVDAFKRVLARSAYLLIPFSVLFCKYFPELGKRYGRWDYKAYYTGVTTNKNALGAICLFLGLFFVWRLLETFSEPKSAPGRTRRLLTAVVILSMVGWLFHMASSMTSLMSFAIGCGILVCTRMKFVKRTPTLATALVLLMVLVVFSVLFLQIGSGALESIGRDSTLTDRTAIWDTVLKVVDNPVLGTGFESFWLGPRLQKIWEDFSWQPYEAHNGYLEIWLNLGWLGIILLAVVVGNGYRNAFNSYRSNIPIGTLCLAYFTIGCIYNFTEAAFFRMMAPAWLFFLAAITNFAKARPVAVPVSRPEVRNDFRFEQAASELTKDPA